MSSFQRARSEQQREVRRQAILDTVAAMLDEMPVSQVTLNELSRRVGLAKSNVLRYFESREAILLELLDRAWKQWLADLPGELETTMSRRGSFERRGEQFAAALAQSLAQRQTFCDLVSAQAAVLEHNVSADVAARYKRAALDNVGALAAIVRERLPEIGDDAIAFCAKATMATGAAWTHSRPSPGMLAAYAADPELATHQLAFDVTLREHVATLIAGTRVRAER